MSGDDLPIRGKTVANDAQPAARVESALPAGGDSRIPLETEPFVFFHPLLAGRSTPGTVQPVPTRPLLEEEPATWPQPAP